MGISPILRAFLADQKITYARHTHPAVYTAQEIAAAQHVPGKNLAKCVLVKTNTGVCLAVLPATHLVDLPKLKKFLRATTLKLANEGDIKRTFPDTDVGAMSPFGNLYQVPTVVDKTLTECDAIVCNAGNHTETIKLRYRDFEAFAKPRVGNFGLHAAMIGRKGKRSAKRKRPTTRKHSAKARRPSSKGRPRKTARKRKRA